MCEGRGIGSQSTDLYVRTGRSAPQQTRPAPSGSPPPSPGRKSGQVPVRSRSPTRTNTNPGSLTRPAWKCHRDHPRPPLTTFCPACQAGGRGFESRRSRSESRCKRAVFLPVDSFDAAARPSWHTSFRCGETRVSGSERDRRKNESRICERPCFLWRVRVYAVRTHFVTLPTPLWVARPQAIVRWDSGGPYPLSIPPRFPHVRGMDTGEPSAIIVVDG